MKSSRAFADPEINSLVAVWGGIADHVFIIFSIFWK